MTPNDKYLEEARSQWDQLLEILYCGANSTLADWLRARDERVRREVWIEAQKLSTQCGSRDHTEEAFRLRAGLGEK